MTFLDWRPGQWITLLAAAPIGFLGLLNAAGWLLLPGCIPMPVEAILSAYVGVGGYLLSRTCIYRLVRGSRASSIPAGSASRDRIPRSR